MLSTFDLKIKSPGKGLIVAFDRFQRELNKIVQKQEFPVEFRAAPIAELLSSRIDALDVERGEAQISYVADERFLHGGGVLQGGILGAMLDFSMAAITLAEIDDGLSVATTNLSIEFLRPAPAGAYVASARAIRKGRSVVFLRAELYDADGNHCASASATNMLISAGRAPAR